MCAQVVLSHSILCNGVAGVTSQIPETWSIVMSQGVTTVMARLDGIVIELIINVVNIGINITLKGDQYWETKVINIKGNRSHI